jgi:cell division protein FtsI/penicillin-binding protein 2
MQARTARRLRRMMEITVHSGTCLEAFSDPNGRSYLSGIRVAGKTGTLKPTSHGPTTSWFIGFAPSRSPELVVSVMLENSPVWRRKANHVARDVMRAYFHTRPGVTHPFEAP